ncbi:MAG: NAD(P)-dependent glycerol-3-phosphate dehydrogenase [Candidatus Nitronauta litoralis]|uniref:Glycerol-3-phosphate dehydrogenase [NAD(P)+] n=1 Tax=Candidatus Nitronauta litoralis TaxID=2705533 RepID=A0A7T0BYU5_9BACT|nr:MAG: NAD(P)-dependent glycerol-3-phosphate dehydrogenase [Candidatus Nitronauta litoralis]
MTPEVAVIGGGSWGTALAIHLGNKGLPVDLWVWESDLAQSMQTTGENRLFLPGFRLPDIVNPVNDLRDAVQSKKIIVLVTPSHVLGSIARSLRPHLAPNAIIVNASKGLEEETLLPASQVIQRELVSKFPLVTLSGPTFAKEVANKVLSTIVVASENPGAAETVQQIFSTDTLRVFTSTDVLGVEIGGSLKNVIAIAAGICDGLELGNNTRAGLITRGLVEISRIGTAMGARAETFYGLSGLGDLVLTCTGDLSRNRMVGIKLGQGDKLKDIIENMKMVAEGIKTVKSAFTLKEKFGIQASIIEQTYRVLYEDKEPGRALADLMKVETGSEFSGVRGLDEA